MIDFFSYYSLIFKYLNLPQPLATITWPIIPFIMIAIIMVLVVLFLVLLERKLLALFTIRKGPNRVGPWGLFQTIADAIKLLTKEDIISKDTNKVLFTLAPILAFYPVMVVYGLVPFGDGLTAINTATNLFLYIAIGILPVFGIVLAGWASNNKYSLIGGMRSAAQAISYEIPFVLSILGIIVLTGSSNLNEIVKAQSQFHGMLGWNFIPSFFGMIIFFICALAEINRTPFDLPEAESELVSGYNTEYSGMKFALFFLGEYAALFVISILFSTLFLGGYLSPFGKYISQLLFSNIVPAIFLPLIIYAEQVFWVFAKAFFVIFMVIWVRATLPRLRTDRLMNFCWKYLLPSALINLIILALISYYLPRGAL